MLEYVYYSDFKYVAHLHTYCCTTTERFQVTWPQYNLKCVFHYYRLLDFSITPSHSEIQLCLSILWHSVGKIFCFSRKLGWTFSTSIWNIVPLKSVKNDEIHHNRRFLSSSSYSLEFLESWLGKSSCEKPIRDETMNSEPWKSMEGHILGH